MADIRNPLVLAAARAAAARYGSIAAAAQVCAEAGFRVSRPNLSRYLNNDLDSVANIETAILACFDRHYCPYLGMEVGADHCREANTGPVLENPFPAQRVPLPLPRHEHQPGRIRPAQGSWKHRYRSTAG